MDMECHGTVPKINCIFGSPELVIVDGCGSLRLGLAAASYSLASHIGGVCAHETCNHEGL